MRDPFSRAPAVLAICLVLAGLLSVSPARAYSYAAAGKEPLIVHGEPLLSAMAEGDWDTANKAYAAMKADLSYLDENEDEGIGKAFTEALDAHDPQGVRKLLTRAYADEIERRLSGARDNIDDYQTAKVLVVKAQQFYQAMAGDLSPDTAGTIEEGLQKALDAIGNPGIFGVGQKKPDPDAFAKAHSKVEAALAGLKPAGK